MNEEARCVSISVKGRVQGVAFRHHTQNQARKYNISGFVKNMPDGSVYIEACGEENHMELFISWCRKGPVMARVTQIHMQEIPMQDFDGFRVRY